MTDEHGNSEQGAGGTSRTLQMVFVKVPWLILAALILVSIGINLANVIARYVFDFALFWAEEIMVFIMVWCVFIGAITVTFNGGHLRMDLVSAHIGSPWRQAVNGLMTLVFIVACVFTAVQSFEVVSLVAGSGQVSTAASVPMVIPHTALLVGFAFVALAAIVRVRSYLKDRFDG